MKKALILAIVALAVVACEPTTPLNTCQKLAGNWRRDNTLRPGGGTYTTEVNMTISAAGSVNATVTPVSGRVGTLRYRIRDCEAAELLGVNHVLPDDPKYNLRVIPVNDNQLRAQFGTYNNNQEDTYRRR